MRKPHCYECEEFGQRIKSARAEGREASVEAWTEAKKFHMQTEHQEAA
jgi:hypothetical protein